VNGASRLRPTMLVCARRFKRTLDHAAYNSCRDASMPWRRAWLLDPRGLRPIGGLYEREELRRLRRPRGVSENGSSVRPARSRSPVSRSRQRRR
jgi:hypothetical protein